MKIVLDTNVLISGIFWGGKPYTIIEIWLNHRIQLFATKKIIKEYFVVLDRIDKSRKSAKKWQKYILENIHIINEKSFIKLSRDPKDDKFVNCAISANATYIVSGDNDLLELKEIGKTKILTPSAFIKVYEKMI
ncbi:putative toxin-antitoxin system toxin component, PIN family [Candidatus Peregrinibacteria bacterium]|nr:putative toxin-antitoxin system toxin component, PIN family [Candidatus Peregrinibacteria bacterium]